MMNVTITIIVVALAIWVLAYISRIIHPTPSIVVANTEFLEELSSYRVARMGARALGMIRVIVAGIAVLSISLLAGRLATEHISSDTFPHRDIVICLDVSGSMSGYDSETLKAFSSMVEDFHGERIALSIFNSTSRIIFPLTTDYKLAKRELSAGASAIDFDEGAYRKGRVIYSPQKVRRYAEFVNGTQGVPNQASIVPDGLATCATLFDHTDKKRSRSIILVTDNEVNGKSIYNLDQAADFVGNRNITLFSFYPGPNQCGATCAGELRTVTLRRGGDFYSSSNPDAVPKFLEKVEKTQASAGGANPQLRPIDQPLWPWIAAVLAVAMLLIIAGKTHS
ncbi:vWA domain-containing protein [Devriesea agamarum]|uniref:vWA domain-containing protein n=1 Tax=Devriesea agamarum TaxID=472569 RepID=UPI00155DDFB3|nr:vWA domain-containing protein [Devriesea agamarum]